MDNLGGPWMNHKWPFNKGPEEDHQAAEEGNGMTEVGATRLTRRGRKGLWNIPEGRSS